MSDCYTHPALRRLSYRVGASWIQCKKRLSMCMESKCILCGVKINNANNTDEHVIPNALGGRLKVKGFICRNCNNITGNTWDCRLCDDLSNICLVFNISRERKKVKPKLLTTNSGDTYWVNPDRTMSLDKPRLKEKKKESGIEFFYKASNYKEVRQFLKSLERKSLNCHIDENKINIEKYTHDIDEVFCLEGGINHCESYKSIVKTCLAFAYYSGIDVNICKTAVKWLKEDNSLPCYGFGLCYENDFVVDRPIDTPLHHLYVKADKDLNCIFCYIELFSAYKFFVCLSDAYAGQTIEKGYSINPVTGKKINLEFKIDLTRNEIIDACNEDCVDVDKVGCILERMADKKYKDDKDKMAIKDIIEGAMAECEKKYSGNLALFEKNFSEIVARRVAEYAIPSRSINKK